MVLKVITKCALDVPQPQQDNTQVSNQQQKVHPLLQELHYYWETKVKQYLLARDEIVVLHVTHKDTQPDRVVMMKQRPSWLHYVFLKNKNPPAQLQLRADVL